MALQERSFPEAYDGDFCNVENHSHGVFLEITRYLIAITGEEDLAQFDALLAELREARIMVERILGRR